MRTKKKIKALLTALLVILLIVAFGVGIHYLDARGDRWFGGREDASADPVYLYLTDREFELEDNIESYLLIGTDASGNEEAAGTTDYKGTMADFLLLIIFDKTQQTYGLLQIDRNTMADVTVYNEEGVDWGSELMQICVSHWYGIDPEQGCQNTMDSVADILGGFPIDGYYSINMKDIGTLNHAVGGVTVKIEDDFSGQDPAMVPGATVHLTDEQAELFVRGRMTVGEGDNASRMRRQRAYMQEFEKLAMEKTKDDPSFVNDLYNQLQEGATTDLPANRVSVIANLMHEYEELGIFEIDGEHKIGQALPDGLDHEEFYASEESMVEILTKLCGLDEGHSY